MTRLVVVESPWKATDAYTVEQHRTYAEYAMLDCFKRGEAPFASHLLYTPILDDDCLPERLQGIEAGLLWGSHCDYVAAYVDMGVSNGMHQAIEHWGKLGKRIERRTIAPGLWKAVREME